MKFSTPLADRMRPETIDEVVGHKNVIGEHSALGILLRKSNPVIPSMLFWGPPGCGKTTLAKVIAAQSGMKFVRLSGVLDGVKELREIVIEAEKNLSNSGIKTLALVDEIHRFNRTQQDAFLPHVESGLLTIIGQTTENVSFKLRSALLSRLKVIKLEALTEEDIRSLVTKTLNDKEKGFGAEGLAIDSEAVDTIIKIASGDARRALNALEWAVPLVQAGNRKLITNLDIKNAYGDQPLAFDQKGDYHYDLVSAFIKSMRGSDPDAALYYMIRALEGGEDPLFLTRRMIIFSSEDASADPRALQMAINCEQAVERVGLPEGRIPMAQCVVYLACCPKSNASYMALRKWEEIIRDNADLPVPLRLRNAPTEMMKDMGHGNGYKYPHDYPDAFVPEKYLPDKINNLEIYQPKDQGLDLQIAERLKKLRARIKNN